MSSGMTAVDVTVMGAWLFSHLAASNAAVFAVPPICPCLHLPVAEWPIATGSG